MYKSNLKIHQITLQQTTWSQSSISESFTCLLIIETFQHQKGTNFVHSILLTTHQVNCLWNERVSFYLFLFSKTCHFLKVTKIQNVFSSSLYLTLFRPGKGGISPYMSVTWPSRLGIGLREINCPQSSCMVNLGLSAFSNFHATRLKFYVREGKQLKLSQIRWFYNMNCLLSFVAWIV